MQYLNKKIVACVVLILAGLFGYLIYRANFDVGYLQINVSEPVDIKILAIDDQQAAQNLGSVSESVTLKLRRGSYIIDASNEAGAVTTLAKNISNRGETTTVNVEISPPTPALIASGFSAGSMGPVDTANKKLLATDASSGSLQVLSSTSDSQVSPLLTKVKSVAYNSSHSGLLITKEREVYFFDTLKHPISTKIGGIVGQGATQIVFDDPSSKFFILDNRMLYSFTPGEKSVSTVSELNNLSTGESYDLAVNGGTALVLGLASNGGEEGIVLSQQRLDSFLINPESGEVKTLENTSGYAALVSPDGRLIGLDQGAYIDWLDASSLDRQFVTSGSVGDCIWTSNTSMLCGRGGGIYEFDIDKKESKRVVSVSAGTPSNIRVASGGNIYFTNTNGKELVIYRSAPNLAGALANPNITFPARTLGFKIDVNHLFGKKPTLVITTFVIVNNPSRDASSFAEQTKTLRKQALQFLKDKGLDLSPFEVVYSP